MSHSHDQIDEILAEYLQKQEAGDTVNVEALLAAHPERADEIRSFLADHDQFSIAGGLPPTIDAPGEQVGMQIDRYKLLQQIGEGGMGTVYMAEQREPVSRRVALKIIKPGMDSKQVIARFEAERQALAMMDHPNIARVLDGGTTPNGRPFFVMELVKGVPITRFCDENRLDVRHRLELFAQVCRAVQHAHQKGIIHRDIKPSNVLVTMHDDRPVPKVIDFGVAKAIEQRLTEKTMFTQYGQIVGTLEYMSPEQAQLNDLDVDTRSDVYSLGVLLFELLTGTTPLPKARLREAAFTEVLRRIREDDTPKPSTRLSDSTEALPSIAAQRGVEPRKLAGLMRGDLDWIVMKALEKDRTRRYETANGFAMDVERHLADEAVTAGPPSVGYKLRKFARRHKRTLASLCAFAVLLIAGTAVSTWQAIRATQAEAETREEKERVIAEKERADEQAAIAKAVNEFLEDDLLAQASPVQQMSRGETANPNVKVRTLLDRAAKKIGDRFRDQPLVEATIRFTIANTYRELGLYRSAEPHFQRALALFSVERGAKHEDTLTVKMALGELYLTQTRYREAERLLTEVARDAPAAFGMDAKRTFEAQAQLGLLYSALGRFDEAEELLSKAHRGFAGRFGEDDEYALETLGALASLTHARGRFREAHKQIAALVRRSEKARGDDHYRTISRRGDLAASHMDLGRYADAERLFRQVIAQLTQIFGDSHPATLHEKGQFALLRLQQGFSNEVEETTAPLISAALAELGPDHRLVLALRHYRANALGSLGRFREAAELHASVAAARSRILGADHPETLKSRSSLAVQYASLGRFDEAVKIAEDVLQKTKDKLGPDHPRTIGARMALAIRYQEQGQLGKAKELLESASAQAGKVLGPDHPYTLAARTYLGSVYESLRDFETALKIAGETFQSKERVLGPTHPDTLQCLGLLARVNMRLRNLKAAEEKARLLLKRARKAYGERSLTTTYAKGIAGHILAAIGKHEEGEKLLLEAIEAAKALSLHDDHPDLLTLKNNLALSWWKRGNRKEAAELHSQILKVRERRLLPNHPHIYYSLCNLGMVYKEMGKPDLALPLLERALDIQSKQCGEDHPQTVELHGHIAGIYLAKFATKRELQWFDKAEDHLAKVVEFGPGRPGISKADVEKAAYAILFVNVRHKRWGRAAMETALRYRVGVIRKSQKESGTNSTLVEAALDRYLSMLALSLLKQKQKKQKKCAQAEPLCREVLALRKKRAPDVWSYFNMQCMLGAALLGQKKFAEAEPLLLNGYAGMKARKDTIPPAARDRLADARRWLVEFYTARGKPGDAEKAARWKAGLPAGRKPVAARRPDG